MYNNYVVFIGLISLISLVSCDPERIDEYNISGVPQPPDFSIVALDDNPNKIEITAISSDAFQLLWDLPGATPKNSKKFKDTILYPKAGEYYITLYASSSQKTGSASTTKKISILQDAPLSCSDELALLTGNCLPDGKCWTFVESAGAVKVGPTYDDFSWYSSPVGGLQGAQYDDRFCFTFDNLLFENRNQGGSVNPWDGYKVQSVNFGISDFIFSEGTGAGGRDQIILQNDQFMGVWDSDNIIDIIKLTEKELVVRAKLRNPAGEPAAEGWFELTFMAVQ